MLKVTDEGKNMTPKNKIRSAPIRFAFHTITANVSMKGLNYTASSTDQILKKKPHFILQSLFPDRRHLCSFLYTSYFPRKKYFTDLRSSREKSERNMLTEYGLLSIFIFEQYIPVVFINNHKYRCICGYIV
jgi:hypothetical protein